MAIPLAGLQAVAIGLVLTGLPVWRGAGLLVSLLLLAALALGLLASPADALLAMAGVAHALLYMALLLVFARTLRPGHTAAVTWLACRINPHFHAGMVAYTRKVTWAWVVFFAGQLAASAVLLAVDLPLWQIFVTILHGPLVVLMAVAEALVRRWRWRHEQPTSLMDTIRGTRRLMGGSG